MTGIREAGRMVRFDGYNYKPETEAAPQAVAMVWLNEGTREDLEAAQKFAKAEGYRVFCFPTSERDPLAVAKSNMMGGAQ